MSLAAGLGDITPARPQGDVLSGIGEALGKCLRAEDLYRTLYEQTSLILDATGFILGLYDEPGQMVTVVYQVDSSTVLPGGSFPLGDGFTSQVIRTHQPRLIRRWSQEGPPVRLQYATDRRGLPESGMTVPLMLGARVVGVLSVQNYKPEAYDATDLLKLQVIAGHAAVALDRVHRSALQNSQLPKRVSELETIISSMSEALLIVDAQGRIVRLNQAARSLLCPEDGPGGIVLGQPLDKEQWGQWPLGPRGVAEALSPLIAALRQGEAIRDLEIEVFGDGKKVLNLSCGPLHDVNGILAGGVIVFRDVTGRREIERIKDEVLSIASHELKGPLTVIKGKAQILQYQIAHGRLTTETIEEGLATIVRGSDHLVELLNLLLDLSRIEAGRFELRRTPSELVDIAVGAVERVRATTLDHELVLDAPERIEGVWDVQRLQQLFQNLLSNAVKYSPKGGTIEISIRGDERQARVRVRDEGVGIPADELPLIFDRFYRSEGVRRLEGSGLGLFICQGIVSAHGGNITAESDGPGQGSSFIFTLPRLPSGRNVGESGPRYRPSEKGG